MQVLFHSKSRIAEEPRSQRIRSFECPPASSLNVATESRNLGAALRPSKYRRRYQPVDTQFILLLRRGPIQPRKVVPSARASLEICMQSVNRTWPPKTGPPWESHRFIRVGSRKGLRQRVVPFSDRKRWVEVKGRNCNDESKDKKMCAHTMPLRCTKWRRVMRRYLS
jgi:hypothetical protein